MIFWDGQPGMIKLFGLGLALVTFLLIGRGHISSHSAEGSLRKLLLLIGGLLLFSGGIGICLKAYSESATDQTNPAFFALMFGVALVTSSIPILRKKLRLEMRDTQIGALMGVMNLVALIAYYTAIARLDGIIVFPSMAAGVIVLGTLVSWKLWHERYNRWTLAGIISACIALVLVNWPE